jgi:hypothetical protein
MGNRPNSSLDLSPVPWNCKFTKAGAKIRGHLGQSVSRTKAVRQPTSPPKSTAMTTMLSPHEAETKRLLGVPDQYQLIALVPMGYPTGGFKRPYRKPVWPRLHDGRWDGPWQKSS